MSKKTLIFVLVIVNTFFLVQKSPCDECTIEEQLIAIHNAQNNFKTHPSMEALEIWHKEASKAYIKIPNSAIVASKYSYVEYIKSNTPVNSIKVLVPFLLTSPDNIAIYYCWLILHSCMINLEVNGDNYLATHQWNS